MPIKGTNHYHILASLPAVEGWEMSPALESMAHRLIVSGRLRVNADHERNFVRHGTADGDETFSVRELTDAALLPLTRQRLARHVAPASGAQGIEDLLILLRGELRKARGISLQKELRVARIIVQSAHPSVIQLLLAARTEIFVSYSHNVGDLMPVHRWQTDGLNSGLQATEETGTAVYISCGGDPFFEGEHKTYTTDGFPALARMMIIGGQELGHFSDLLRQNGRIVGRYSLDSHHMGMRAAPPVAHARNADMARVAQLSQQYHQAGLARLIAAETAVAFYSKRWRFGPPSLFHQCRRLILLSLFKMRERRLVIPALRRDLSARAMDPGVARANRDDNYHGLSTLNFYPHMRHGTALATFLADMAFNLAPEADVYRRSDPLEEEAIACVEALARVPQQMHKFGHHAVRFAWPGLYSIYYDTVIPGCIAASPEAGPSLAKSFSQRLSIALRHRFCKRPDYYPG